MIRILHVVTYMGRGGLETMIMNYYRNIDRTNVQFDFLVHREFEADYDQEISRLGGRIYHVSRLVPWSKKYKKELENFLAKHSEYKIIHVHQDCLSSVILKCANNQGIPVRIAHSHSASAVKDIKYPLKVHYMKQISKYATHLFACGKQAGDWMFCGNKYKIIRNAIDTEKYEYSAEIAFKIRQELGLAEALVIGHVGNFTPAKNHSFLLRIFQAIHKIKPEAKLVLVGGGDAMNTVKEEAASIGVQEQMVFTGVRTDVNELMQAMDVFVFPSLYEGLPVTMIEAQAAGLPCVISDHVSSECIITNGLVSSNKLDDSVEEWAKQILQQSEVPRENHRKEIIDAGYDIKTAARELEKFYLSQIEG